MLDIFRFYIGIVLDIFNRVLNGFTISPGLGFGTFLLSCSIFVAFISLIRFKYYNPSVNALRQYREDSYYSGKKKIVPGVESKQVISKKQILRRK